MPRPSRAEEVEIANSRLRAIVVKLTEREQKEFWLLFNTDISTKEAAEILGTTEGAIRTRRCRFRQKLKNFDKDKADEDDA